MDRQVVVARFVVRHAALKLADTVGRAKGEGGGPAQQRGRQKGGGRRDRPAVRRCPTPHPPRKGQLPAQGGRQLGRALGTALRLLRQATFDQAGKPLVNPLVSAANRRRPLGLPLAQVARRFLHRTIAGDGTKGKRAGQQLVDDHSQGEQIARRIVTLRTSACRLFADPGQLLRRHVGQGPPDLPYRTLLLDGQVEIQQQRPTGGREQNIGRFQVSMGYAAAVGVRQGLGDLRSQVKHPLHVRPGEQNSRRRDRLRQFQARIGGPDRLQNHAGPHGDATPAKDRFVYGGDRGLTQVGHANPRQAGQVVLANGMYRHDVRMPKPGELFGFLPALQDHLEHHRPLAQGLLRRQEYPAERPSANLANQVEAQEVCAGLGPHDSRRLLFGLPFAGQYKAIDADQLEEIALYARKSPGEFGGIQHLARIHSNSVFLAGQFEDDLRIVVEFGLSCQQGSQIRRLACSPAVLDRGGRATGIGHAAGVGGPRFRTCGGIVCHWGNGTPGRGYPESSLGHLGH